MLLFSDCDLRSNQHMPEFRLVSLECHMPIPILQSVVVTQVIGCMWPNARRGDVIQAERQ